MRNRSTIEVICMDCSISYQKRIDGLKNWSGMCRNCANRKAASSDKKKVPMPKCKNCNKESRDIKSSGFCKKCFKRPKEEHYKWKTDRTTLSKKQERNDVAYKEWRRLVWERDSYKCQLSDKTCLGKIEAHHIILWSKSIELRYKISNGITLCHKHHPRRKQEEEDMIPILKDIIYNKKS